MNEHKPRRASVSMKNGYGDVVDSRVMRSLRNRQLCIKIAGKQEVLRQIRPTVYSAGVLRSLIRKQSIASHSDEWWAQRSAKVAKRPSTFLGRAHSCPHAGTPLCAEGSARREGVPLAAFFMKSGCIKQGVHIHAWHLLD